MNADLAEALTRYIQRELIADRAALRGIAESDSDRIVGEGQAGQ